MIYTEAGETMGLFENFPYANFHELNLDWILHELRELETEITNFVAINSVKYANPITWDITSQYETNTVVLDSSGNAYLSVQPVPAGVALDREEYWTKIGNFSALWDSVRSAITPYDEQHSTTASVNHKAGDWVWVENDLLLITKDITAGDKYVDGGNCKKTNVHDIFVTLSGELQNADISLDTKITAEASARENGDTALDTKITAEATARESADTALDTKITAEASARESADTTLNTKINNATTSIEENRNIVSLQEFGVTGAGDESEKVKQAFAWAKAHGIGKIVSKTDVQFSGIVIDFSVDIDFYGHTAQGVRIHDQTNRIKTMFTASTSGLTISFRNMKLKGYSDLTDAGVKPVVSSPIEITNAHCIVFENCTFENVNARYYDTIPAKMVDRKGVLYTIHDCANTEFRSCIINNCNGEELGYVIAVAKPREYVNCRMDSCHYNAPINTSSIDFVGNTIIFKNNIFNYDYDGSYTNAFALHLIASGDTVNGHGNSSLYDNCEELFWQGDDVDISNVTINGSLKILADVAANACHIHDIKDTSKITNTVVALRPGYGGQNSANFPYSATSKLDDPFAVISNVAVTAPVVLARCGDFEDEKTTPYNVVVRNIIIPTGNARWIPLEACKTLLIDNSKIFNTVDTGFSSTAVGILFNQKSPDIIRITNCVFVNVNKTAQEYLLGGCNGKLILVNNSTSDSTNEQGDKVTTDGNTISAGNNIKIVS